MSEKPRPRGGAEELRAADGLRARDNGAWAEDKLAFLTTFGPPALKATQSMPTRHYLDLFAGPGINRVRGTAATEIEGSPLRALELSAPGEPTLHFTHATFVNRDARDHRALEQRVGWRVKAGRSLIPREKVRCVPGNANEVLYGILGAIHPRAYVFAFADITAPKQLPWASVRALREYGGHQSVDLYMLFPLDMALKRLLSYRPGATENCAAVLTDFFGTDEWRGLYTRRPSSAQGAELGRALEALYLRQLKTAWKYARTVSDVRRGQCHRLYKMLFASNHSAGNDIANWAAARSAQQLSLL